TLYQGADAAGIDVSHLRELQLMTAKPFIYVFNTDEQGLADTAMQERMRALVAPAEAIFLDAKFESELIELDEDEAAEMLESTGQEESGLDQLARVGFDTLGCRPTSPPAPRNPAPGPSPREPPPRRPPASSTPTSSAASSRRRSSPSTSSWMPARWPRRRPGARCAWRARST